MRVVKIHMSVPWTKFSLKDFKNREKIFISGVLFMIFKETYYAAQVAAPTVISGSEKSM